MWTDCYHCELTCDDDPQDLGVRSMAISTSTAIGLCPISRSINCTCGAAIYSRACSSNIIFKSSPLSTVPRYNCLL